MAKTGERNGERNSGQKSGQNGERQEAHTEPHRSIPEVAKILKISLPTARKIFRDEPGVKFLRLGKQRKRARMRIPESVLKRVAKELEKKNGK